MVDRKQKTDNRNQDLQKRIEESYARLSKGQKRLADYISQHYSKAVFLTAARLGQAVGVSESTVVRFAVRLGYEGYPTLHKAMEELVKSSLDPIERMELTFERMGKANILETVLMSDIDKIKQTLDCIDRRAFYLAADLLLAARRIYIVGIRSCAPLASFLAFYLNLIFDGVVLISTDGSSEIFEQLVRINEEDVIVGLSFPRYSMRILKALEFANDRRAKIITLTDSVHSPITLYSSCNLIVKGDMSSIIDSFSAPLSVVNALVVSVCMKRQKEALSTLQTLKEIWDEYQVRREDDLYRPILDKAIPKEDKSKGSF